MKEVSHVYETNDYSMFKTLNGNRSIQNLHVKRLKRSFEADYLFSPIIINEKNEIIDGQHRFAAAQELKYPIRFLVCKGYGLKEIQTLNANMKNWKREDYLDGYCDLKYPEYLKFRNFMRRFPEFGIASAEVILTQLSQAPKDYTLIKEIGAASQYFEQGRLLIPDYEGSCECAEILMLFKPHYDGFNRRVFVIAMVSILKNPNFSYSELLSKLKVNPGGLQHCSLVGQYKLLIEDIYNYRRREKISLRY
jgi:hypothetical protein